MTNPNLISVSPPPPQEARAVIAAAKAWRASLGDSAEQWLTDKALDLVHAIDTLDREMPTYG